MQTHLIRFRYRFRRLSKPFSASAPLPSPTYRTSRVFASRTIVTYFLSDAAFGKRYISSIVRASTFASETWANSFSSHDFSMDFTWSHESCSVSATCLIDMPPRKAMTVFASDFVTRIFPPARNGTFSTLEEPQSGQ